VPGPGAYEPKVDQRVKKAPEIKIGTSSRYDFTSSNGPGKPGPGNYSPAHTLTHTKSEKWVFSSERRKGTMNKNVLQVPGPA
jgi:hypothetical protein